MSRIARPPSPRGRILDFEGGSGLNARPMTVPCTATARSRPGLRLLPLLSLVWLSASCATAPQRDLSPGSSAVGLPTRPELLGRPRGVVEISNRTTDPWVVAIDGQDVGVVEAGSRGRFSNIPVGPRAVTARLARAPEGDTGARMHARLEVPSGERVEWVLLPLTLGAEPPAAPPPLGGLRLVGEAAVAVDVRVEGEGVAPSEWRRLPAGATLELPDLAPGARRLRLRLPAGDERLVPVVVHANTVTDVPVRLSVGVLRVVAGQHEGVTLIEAGSAVLVLSAGERGSVELSEGVHHLVARGRNSGREARRSLVLRRGDERLWDLGAGAARVQVHNLTAAALDLAVDGLARGSVGARDRVMLEDVPAGDVRITADDSSGAALRHATLLRVEPGRELIWQVTVGFGALRVDNGLDEAALVQLDGATESVIAPGGSAFYTHLASGEHRVQARGLETGRVVAFTAEVRADDPGIVRLLAKEAALEVENTLPEPVAITAAGRRLGLVPANSRAVLANAPVGEVALIARTLDGGTEVSDSAVLSTGATTFWSVSRAVGQLRVENQTGEPLRSPPSLRSQRAEVRNGEQLDFQVEAGARVLRFVGTVSGLVYGVERRFVRGQREDWTAVPQRGRLHVLSRLDEAVEIVVGGEDPVRLEAGREQVLTLAAGAHRLVARGVDSGSAHTRSVRLGNESTLTWELRPLLGYVRVENRSLETLEVLAGGEPLGRVEAESHEIWGPFGQGRAQTLALTARGSRTGVIYRTVMDVHGGVLEPWVIHPTHGVLRVVNAREEPIRVFIDRESPRVLAAHANMDLDLPLGQHRVELVGTETHRSFLHSVAIRPDRAVPVEAPRYDRAVRVTNRGDEAITLRDEEHELGRVDAGESRVVPLPEAHVLVILATGDRSGRRWQRRLTAGSDHVIDWEIGP